MRSFLFSALIIIASACNTSTTDDSDQIDPAAAGKADGVSTPTGNYTNATPRIGQLATLTLNDDHTFNSTEVGACPGGGTCAPMTESGTFLFTHSSTKKYIRFYADDGSSIDRFQYKMVGTKLELELDGETSFFSMSAGGSCASAGGSCITSTLATEDGCRFGTIGDATQDACSTHGDVCCIPEAPSNSCDSPSDCKGLLPDFCRACDNGADSCAHWSCVNHGCEIATCD